MAERTYTLEELRRVAVVVSGRTFSDDLLRDIDAEVSLIDAERQEEQRGHISTP